MFTRSVLGAEVHAFSHCLDFCASFIPRPFSNTPAESVDLIFTDSKCLFDTITKLSTVSEKRLLIDISAIREAYSNGDLTNVAHVASEYNLADTFTKSNADTTMLRQLMQTGTLNHTVNQWILPQ